MTREGTGLNTGIATTSELEHFSTSRQNQDGTTGWRIWLRIGMSGYEKFRHPGPRWDLMPAA